MDFKITDFCLDRGKPVRLADFPTAYHGKLTKEDAQKKMESLNKKLRDLQALLYADGSKSLLVVLQAMDAAGKDSTIRHVFGPLNPQGCKVVSFKGPNSTELAHDFLWRVHQNVPRKGHIGVFNRSHYEDVLIVRVKNMAPREIVKRRYDHINNFEANLTDGGTRVIKFFLHISADCQKERLQARLDNPEKLWKFSPSDIPERMLWNDYQRAFEIALEKCATPIAPWYVIPAEKKWFRNLVIAQVLVNTLESMHLHYPKADFDPAEIKIP